MLNFYLKCCILKTRKPLKGDIDMIKVILGAKGSGKTAKLIDSVNAAMEQEKGAVVFITNSDRHTYDLKSSIRLVDACEYGITDYEKFFGFIGGILSQNFDITNIFIDATLRIGGRDLDELEKFILALDKQVGDDVTITMTLSVDAALVSDEIKKFA